MKFLYLFFLILMASNFSFAEVKVEADDFVLRGIDMWVGSGPVFEDSFVCGQVETFISTVANCRYKCNDNYCTSSCSSYPNEERRSFRLKVEECSSEQVKIYGENGFEATVTREEYEKAGNTWLLGLLKAHGMFVSPEGPRVSVDSIIPRDLLIAGGGDLKKILGYSAFNSIFYGTAKQGYNTEVIMIPSEKGLRQLGSFRDGREDYYMQRRGFSEAMPR